MPIEPPPGAYDDDGHPLNSDEGSVWVAMLSSLKPLADWLEDDGELTPLLRTELIEVLRNPAIEKAFHESQTPSDAERRRWDRREREAAIGAWVAVRVDNGARGSQKRILFLASSRFKISEALAEKHLNFFRKQDRLDWDDRDFDTLTLRENEFDAMCLDFGLDPASARNEINSGKNLALKF